MKHPVACVGVGNMGGAMAARLLECGWPVRVHDVDRGKVDALAALGAHACADAAQASAGVRLLVVCVVDAAQVRDVLFGASGACERLAPGATVMLCPTISPGDVEDVAGTLARRGLHTIDSPMSGGPSRARDGSMSLMVACAAEVFEQHAEVIAALSSKVFRIGERLGDGARTKLVNNLLAGINLVGAAEALALAQRLGLELRTTLDVIEQSSGQSWIGSDRMRRAVVGDYEPRAHMTLLEKDTRLAMEAAAQAGFEGPLGGSARDTFARASASGLAGLDDAAVFRLLAGDAP
jgi:3-hydroxyisobutyrate dehydrogenase